MQLATGPGSCLTILFFIFAAFSLQVQGAEAKSADLGINRLLALPSDELLKEGLRWGQFGAHPDSALMAYTIVAGRDDPRMKPEERKNSIAANNGLWFIYFSEYFDYAASNKHLTQALKICDEIGHNKASVYLNFGSMYHTIGESTGDTTLYGDALKYYELSIQEGVKYPECATQVLSALSNIVQLNYQRNSLAGCQNWISLTDNYVNKIQTNIDSGLDKDQSFLLDYTHLLYEIYECLNRDDWDGGLQKLDKVTKLCGEDAPVRMRFYLYILLLRADVHRLAKRPEKAVECLQTVCKIAEAYQLKDARLLAYSEMAHTFEDAGNQDMADQARHRYLELKDTLLNYHQLASVNEMQYQNKVEEISAEMAAEKDRAHKMLTILWWGLGVAAAAGCVVVIIIVNNRRLRRANEMLYRQNMEIMHTAEQAAAQRAAARMNRSMGDSATGDSPSTEPEVSESQERKYKNSTLGNVQARELMARIQEVLDNRPEEVCVQGFSVNSLAAMVGAQPRHVSQVINERGTNFSVFIGDWRIRRACRIIIDQVAERGEFAWSVEGLGKSVGFGTHKSFAQTFKRVTGLSPSEYIRLTCAGKSNTFEKI